MNKKNEPVWSSRECENGCESNSCKAECTNGDSKCIISLDNESAAIYQCKNSVWTRLVSCDDNDIHYLCYDEKLCADCSAEESHLVCTENGTNAELNGCEVSKLYSSISPLTGLSVHQNCPAGCNNDNTQCGCKDGKIEAEDFDGGKTVYYCINNESELKAFRDGINNGIMWPTNEEILYAPETFAQENLHYILMSDIHITNEDDWIPIGNVDHPFEGIFNGNGYTIDFENAKYPQTLTDKSFGLFGYVQYTKIKDLTIKNMNLPEEFVESNYACGVLTGVYRNILAKNIHIESCTLRGGGGSYHLKERWPYMFSYRWYEEDIPSGVGGFAGLGVGSSMINDITIKDISVNSNKTRLGGFIGHFYNNSYSKDSYSRVSNIDVESVNIQGGSILGGFIGSVGCADTNIGACTGPVYLDGIRLNNAKISVSGSSDSSGGFIGLLQRSKSTNNTFYISNSFSDVEITKQNKAKIGGFIGNDTIATVINNVTAYMKNDYVGFMYSMCNGICLPNLTINSVYSIGNKDNKLISQGTEVKVNIKNAYTFTTGEEYSKIIPDNVQPSGDLTLYSQFKDEGSNDGIILYNISSDKIAMVGDKTLAEALNENYEENPPFVMKKCQLKFGETTFEYTLPVIESLIPSSMTCE